VFETSIEFNKLEKVEIGGMKGRILSHDVVQIFTEFQECFAVFASSSYDSLNYQDNVRTFSRLNKQFISGTGTSVTSWYN